MREDISVERDFSLYWWQPKGGWTNLGDEVSPIIFSHVTGRRVSWASIDQCDGIAIGSIFNPRRLSKRKRSKPVLVWGSGTLAPRACEYKNLEVVLAALRGPKTAGMIAGCPLVPFGDPGLFVHVLWKKRDTVPGRVGIIPHHSLKRHPYTKILAQQVGERNDAVVIDFTASDMDVTMNTLSSCELVISSSLHGLIFSDAYGIPSLFWNEGGEENEWKFRDYFEGVGRCDFHALDAEEIIVRLQSGDINSLPYSGITSYARHQILEDLRVAAQRVEDLL